MDGLELLLAAVGRADAVVAGAVALGGLLIAAYALRMLRSSIRQRWVFPAIVCVVATLAAAVLAFAAAADLFGLLDHIAWADALSDILLDLLIVCVGALWATKLLRRRRA